MTTTAAATPTMRAYVARRYGPPESLELADLPIPELQSGQALVRVRAAGVNPVDWHRMSGSPGLVRLMEGPRRPKNPRLGADIAGVVAAVGPDVTTVAVGDEVMGMTVGSFAELCAVKAIGLVPKPRNLSLEEAGAIPVAAITALQGLRDVAGLHAGRARGARVLVNGAAGGVGHFAVQIAGAWGAEVTGVCSTPAVEMVRSLGADRVVDYSREDFASTDERYDVIFDCVGNRSDGTLGRLLVDRGTAILNGGADHSSLVIVAGMVVSAVRSKLGSRKFGSFLAHRDQADLQLLRELAEGGKLRPVIDGRYPLAALPDAMARSMAGHVHGKLVVTI